MRSARVRCAGRRVGDGVGATARQGRLVSAPVLPPGRRMMPEGYDQGSGTGPRPRSRNGLLPRHRPRHHVHGGGCRARGRGRSPDPGQPHGVGALGRLPPRRRRDPGGRGGHPPRHQRPRPRRPRVQAPGRRPHAHHPRRHPVRGRDADGPAAALVGRPGARAAGRGRRGPSPSPTPPTGVPTSSTCSRRRCARSTSTPRCCSPSRWRPPPSTRRSARLDARARSSPCTTWAVAPSTPRWCAATTGGFEIIGHARGHGAPRRHRLRRGRVRPRPQRRGRRARPPRPRGAGGAGRGGPTPAGVHRRQGGALQRHRRVDPGAAARPADRGAPHPVRVRGDDPTGHLRDDRGPAPGDPLRLGQSRTTSAPSCWWAGRPASRSSPRWWEPSWDGPSPSTRTPRTPSPSGPPSPSPRSGVRPRPSP